MQLIFDLKERKTLDRIKECTPRAGVGSAARRLDIVAYATGCGPESRHRVACDPMIDEQALAGRGHDENFSGYSPA
jgi:hypothetical protein